MVCFSRSLADAASFCGLLDLVVFGSDVYRRSQATQPSYAFELVQQQPNPDDVETFSAAVGLAAVATVYACNQSRPAVVLAALAAATGSLAFLYTTFLQLRSDVAVSNNPQYVVGDHFWLVRPDLFKPRNEQPRLLYTELELRNVMCAVCDLALAPDVHHSRQSPHPGVLLQRACKAPSRWIC